MATMIEYVTLQTLDYFDGNPIAEQHRLRYRSIIERQAWQVPFYDGMEFDQYDNPAAKYLVYRDENGLVRGSSRFYPTELPYMLEQVFPHFVTKREIPKSEYIWEGSRFCIDHTLPLEHRRCIIQEIVVAYLETALHFGVKEIIGLMYPAYWKSIFIKSGWPIEYIGDVLKLDDGKKSCSASLPVSHAILKNVRAVTGIHNEIVNYGSRYENKTTFNAAA